MIGLLCQVKSNRYIFCGEEVIKRGYRSIVSKETAFEHNPEKCGQVESQCSLIKRMANTASKAKKPGISLTD